MRFIRHDGMKHFVKNYVFEKPRRNKRRVEPRMNPDGPVLFLDRSENEIVFRRELSSLAPRDLVAAQPIAKISRVQPPEDFLKVEVFSLVLKWELPLQRKLRTGNFALCFSHDAGRF